MKRECEYLIFVLSKFTNRRDFNARGQNLSLIHISTVEPGLLLMDMIATMDSNDVFYPPDPGEKSATIGGNVMTNAGGMRAVRYGVTRDFVRGLDVVLANGHKVTLGGKLAKNSSGYSLKDLMIGSEGTLGVVTKITVKLLPKMCIRDRGCTPPDLFQVGPPVQIPA